MGRANDELLALVLRLFRSDERLRSAAGAVEASMPRRVARLEATLKPWHTLERVYDICEEAKRDALRNRAVRRLGTRSGETGVERVFKHLANLLADYNAVRRRTHAEAPLPGLDSPDVAALLGGGADDNDDDGDDDDGGHENALARRRRRSRRESAPAALPDVTAPRRAKRKVSSGTADAVAAVGDAAPPSLFDWIDVNTAAAPVAMTASSSTADAATAPRVNKRKKSQPRKKAPEPLFVGGAADTAATNDGAWHSLVADNAGAENAASTEDALLQLLRNDEMQFETAESLAQHINQIVAASSLGHLASSHSQQQQQQQHQQPHLSLLDDHDVDAIVQSFLSSDPLGARLLSPTRARAPPPQVQQPTQPPPHRDEDSVLMPPPPTTPLRKRARVPERVAPTLDIDSFLANLHPEAVPPPPPPPPPPPVPRSPRAQSPRAQQPEVAAGDAIDLESFLSKLHRV